MKTNYRDKVTGEIAIYDSFMGLWYIRGRNYDNGNPIPSSEWEFIDNERMEDIGPFSMEKLDLYFPLIMRMGRDNPILGFSYILKNKQGSDIAELYFSYEMDGKLTVIKDNYPQQRKTYNTTFPILSPDDVEVQMKKIGLELY